MRAAVLPLCGAALLLSVVGCGPMTTPMPARLDAEQQAKIDAGWNKAMTPVGKLDRQAIMDLMVLRYAFEVGVDKLDFRSEKTFVGGKAVMTITFDRAVPAADRLEFTVFDTKGRAVRTERYTRADVENTAQAFHDHIRLKSRSDQGVATADEQKQLAELDARMKVVGEVFPSIPIHHGEIQIGPDE